MSLHVKFKQEVSEIRQTSKVLLYVILALITNDEEYFFSSVVESAGYRMKTKTFLSFFLILFFGQNYRQLQSLTMYTKHFCVHSGWIRHTKKILVPNPTLHFMIYYQCQHWYSKVESNSVEVRVMDECVANQTYCTGRSLCLVPDLQFMFFNQDLHQSFPVL